MAACGWGSVPTTNPKQVHLSSAGTNVVTEKKTSPFVSTMPFPGQQGRPDAADALAGWECTQGAATGRRNVRNQDRPLVGATKSFGVVQILGRLPELSSSLMNMPLHFYHADLFDVTLDVGGRSCWFIYELP